MQRRRSVSCKFEKNISAEKAKLEAQLANLEAQLAFLNMARPTMDLLRIGIRQLDTVAISQSLSSPLMGNHRTGGADNRHRRDSFLHRR
jgi:hypothetical protein